MRIEDVIVEPADKSLVRQGQIAASKLNLEAIAAHNDTGSWKLILPIESVAIPVLSKPGSRLIITTDSGQFLSGPCKIDETVQGSDDPAGTVTFTGTTDNVLLKQRLAYPQPANPNVATQTDADWKMTGTVEAVMHALVSANLGPDAPSPRRDERLVMGTNLGRGPVISVVARFEPLHDVLAKLAAANAFTFGIAQRGDVLVFETAPMVDRSAEVRLSVEGGSLSSSKVALSAPGVTHVIVGGEGAAKTRTFSEMTTPESLQGESQWGERIERYVDAGTGTPDEIKQPALDVLSAESNTGVSTQSVPSEDSDMGFGIDYFVGDQVAVEVDGQEPTAVVSGAILKADADGVRLQITLGDPLGFDPVARAVSTALAAVGKVNRVALNEIPFAQVAVFEGWRAPDTEQIDGDDALVSPTKPGVIQDAAYGFGVSPAYGNRVGVTVTVPAGFTQAHLSLVGRVSALNNSSTPDYLLSRLWIDGWASGGMYVLASINFTVLNVSASSRVLTGLVPGSTFDISVQARTNTETWVTSVGNGAEISGSITWYR